MSAAVVLTGRRRRPRRPGRRDLPGLPTFVVRGLDRSPPAVAVAAMQGIDASAPHPLVMIPLFVGPLAGLALVTAAFHIPRSTALDRLDPTAPEAPAAWERDVREWVGGDHVRTLGALAGTVAMTVALVA